MILQKVTRNNRLYNPNSGEHFYAEKLDEKNHLVSLGWKCEGIAWTSLVKSDYQVYTLYNPNAGDYHYPMNKQERDILVTAGWQYEGISLYSFPANQGIKVYREYNPNAKAGSHNYTPNKNEHDHLTSIGWKDEGIAWYGLK